MGYSDGGAGFKRKWEGMSEEERRAYLARSFHSDDARQRADASIKKAWSCHTPEERQARIEAAAHGVRRASGQKSESMLRYWAGKSEEERQQHYLTSFGSEESKRKVAESSRRVWDSYTEEERKARMEGWLNSREAKENWKKTWAAKSEEEKEEWVKVHLRGRRRPTEPERLLGLYLDKNFPGEWKYNGDRVEGVFVSGKIPDFINVNGKKEIIEVFGYYWHNIDEVEPLIEHYKKFGFKCTVLWDYECYFEKDMRERLG